MQDKYLKADKCISNLSLIINQYEDQLAGIEDLIETRLNDKEYSFDYLNSVDGKLLLEIKRLLDE